MLSRGDYGPDPMETQSTTQAVITTHVVDQNGQSLDHLFSDGAPEAPPPEVENGHSKPPPNVDASMVMAVGVQFKIAGRIYEFDSNGMELPMRTVVIADTESGQAMGEVVRPPRPVPRDALPQRIFPVQRLASRHDYRQREKNREMESEMLNFAIQKAYEDKIPMKVVSSEVFQSGKKAVLYFSADDRIDFRDFVKELISRYRLRVELRQVGPRDAAKIIGGIGDCGRELCCSTFLRDFAPVSIRMAKDQGLALNPNKISGQCGKLKCCLAYEDDVYRDLAKTLPKVGKKVSCASGCGSVASRNVLKQELTVVLDDGARVTLHSGEWEMMSAQRRDVAGPSEDHGDDDAPESDDPSGTKES